MTEHKQVSNKSASSGGSRIKDFFRVNEVFGYFFRRKDPSRPSNINIRMMHGINKISILIFLVGVLYLVFKLVIKPML